MECKKKQKSATVYLIVFTSTSVAAILSDEKQKQIQDLMRSWVV